MDAIIVPCTREKIWDTHPKAGAVAARDAYTKAAFRAWRAYAEHSESPWFILSTKYGLIRPDLMIDRYDVPVAAAIEDRAFSELLVRQGSELNLRQFDRIVLLDWERFLPLVRAAVANQNVQCEVRKLQY